MSKLEGGIFSNPSGQTSGIVFGAARTRRGKVVTARQLVSPSNPNTAAQQEQRTKFSESLTIVRAIGATIYQGDFNRAISQLPGFQSMMSIYLNNMNSSFTIGSISDTNLGLLHLPDTLTVTAGTTGVIDVDWSTELGANGTTADQFVAFAVPNDQSNRADFDVMTSVAASIRSDAALAITGLGETIEYSIGMYFRGVGTALNTLTVARYGIIDAG